MSNIEYRSVIKFFTRKGLNAAEISKELNDVYKDSAPAYRTVAKWVAEFKDPERGFEDLPRTGRPSITADEENIKAVERIVMRDRQISIRRVAYELDISTTSVYEIMKSQLGMKKVSTRWVPKLLTPIQRANRVDCCEELLQESEEDPADFFDQIVTGDETWIYYYDPLSQREAKVWKKPNEETPTQLRRTRSAGKIMMIVFWDKNGILFTEYLPRGTTIDGSYYASIIDQLHAVILKKRRGKLGRGVLLLHDNAPVHKCKVAEAAIRQAGIVELNHPSYSPDIAPSDYYLFSNLKRFLRGKDFSGEDEAIDTVEDYLTNLDSDFFCKGIESLRDRWQRVVDSEGQYI